MCSVHPVLSHHVLPPPVILYLQPTSQLCCQKSNTLIPLYFIPSAQTVHNVKYEVLNAHFTLVLSHQHNTHSHMQGGHTHIRSHLSLFGSVRWLRASILSLASLQCYISAGGVSDLETSVAGSCQTHEQTLFYSEPYSLPSTPPLKCWWFILGAIFTPLQVFVCRIRT